MAAASEEYKQKLRQWSASQHPQDPLQPGEVTGSSPTVKKVTTLDKATDTGGIKDYPVVSMADFEIVNTNDKLNLLMSAVNKINTNLHLKLESLQTYINDNMAKKLTSLETKYEALLARADDAETAIAGIQVNRSNIETLEDQLAKVMDEVSTLKGIVQIQDMEIKDCKGKIVNLTARSMSNNVIMHGPKVPCRCRLHT